MRIISYGETLVSGTFRIKHRIMMRSNSFGAISRHGRIENVYNINSSMTEEDAINTAITKSKFSGIGSNTFDNPTRQELCSYRAMRYANPPSNPLPKKSGLVAIAAMKAADAKMQKAAEKPGEKTHINTNCNMCLFDAVSKKLNDPALTPEVLKILTVMKMKSLIGVDDSYTEEHVKSIEIGDQSDEQTIKCLSIVISRIILVEGWEKSGVIGDGQSNDILAIKWIAGRDYSGHFY